MYGSLSYGQLNYGEYYPSKTVNLYLNDSVFISEPKFVIAGLFLILKDIVSCNDRGEDYPYLGGNYFGTVYFGGDIAFNPIYFLMTLISYTRPIYKYTKGIFGSTKKQLLYAESKVQKIFGNVKNQKIYGNSKSQNINGNNRSDKIDGNIGR